MAEKRPERVVVTNIDDASFVTAQFNPDEVKEKLAVNWARFKVLGTPGEELQYEGTSNLGLSFELGFDAMSGEGAGRLDVPGPGGIEDARRFLHALCYPKKAASSIADGGAPRVLFYWPGLYAIVSRVISLEITHRRFAWTMESTLFAATVTLEEQSIFRLNREDVLSYGTLRAG